MRDLYKAAAPQVGGGRSVQSVQFRAAAESKSRRRFRHNKMSNTCELSMGETRDMCKRKRIKLFTTVPYHPTSNSVAELTIRVLTNVVHHESGLLKSFWVEATFAIGR